MSAPAVCTDLKVYCVLSILLLFSYHHVRIGSAEEVTQEDKDSMRLLLASGKDIIKSTFRLIDGVEPIRQKHINKPSFEIGYLMFTVFEKYRKMVDRYQTVIMLKQQLFSMELVMYLEDIENYHWEVQHISNMLHEIERKYNVSTPINTKYRERTSEEIKEEQAKEKEERDYHRTVDMVETTKVRIPKKLLERLHPTPSTTTKTPWPIDYGWRL